MDKAIEWLMILAAQRYISVEVNLDFIFIYEMSKYNYAKAIQWYAMASESDNPQALCNLGLIYEYGKGIPVNYQRAFQLYAQASRYGSIPDTLLNIKNVSERVSGGFRFKPMMALKAFKCVTKQNDPNA
ncbi:tetratricopeptide repeat protein [Coxiella-like endosymbiont]|uniref:tetratricopeptide repeat protein n=1 Tax=Coxiella-like endosymbiont TaxID=1592897 RepID=UPI00272AB0F8|nr:hypothetical protein [Coxiella-like endosymbiont]